MGYSKYLLLWDTAFPILRLQLWRVLISSLKLSLTTCQLRYQVWLFQMFRTMQLFPHLAHWFVNPSPPLKSREREGLFSTIQQYSCENWQQQNTKGCQKGIKPNFHCNPEQVDSTYITNSKGCCNWVKFIHIICINFAFSSLHWLPSLFTYYSQLTQFAVCEVN